MNKRALNFFLLLCISACRPPSYYPSQQIIPTLSKKGNVQLSAGIGSGAEYLYQISGSPLEHLGLYIGNQRILPQYRDHKHTLTEGGIGFYTHTSAGTYWAAYACYGFGSVDAKSGNKYVENDFKRYSFFLFNSPKIGNKFVTTGIRCDYSKLYKFSRYEINDGVKTYTAKGDRNKFLIGPVLGTSFTGPGGALQVQAGCSAMIGDTPIGKWIKSMFVYASGTLVLDFNY